MRIGTRLVNPEEVGLWNAELLQISVYRNMENNLDIMIDSARACREAGIDYVIHPLGYSLLDEKVFETLALIAEWSDLALILHDERTPEGERLTGSNKMQFQRSIDELGAITHISLENSTNTADVQWFWETFADSITIDIGHIESAGLNSVEFIKSLDDDIIHKIEFAHMHRNNGLHGGITDHWPLRRECREIKALEELMKKKSDISVILELNETDEIGESLSILNELRNNCVSDASLPGGV